MQDNQNAMAKKILDLATESASLQKRLEKRNERSI